MASQFQDPPREALLAPGERKIRSAEVSTLTSAGLGELKRLINEAAVRRVSLVSQVAGADKALAKARGRLKLARTFIVRLFTSKTIPRLAEAVDAAEQHLEQSRAELEGCIVEVDFGFDDATLGSYAALTRAFGALRSCQRIWDITSTSAINRVAERTVATTAIRRTAVRFDIANPLIVKSQHQVLQLGNVAGRDIQIFPGFVMMRDAGHDFALIEYREFHASLRHSNFVEEESVPSDTQVIGQTWKKANKDGSPDRRFNDNYAIPIVEYGELTLSSPTGLLEAYQFSNVGHAEGFAQALEAHKRALASLSNGEASSPEAEDSDEALQPHEDDSPPTVAVPQPPTGLWLDWVALGVIIVAIGWGGFWVRDHAAIIKAAFAPPAPIETPAATVPATPAPTTTPTHHHHRHHHVVAAHVTP